MSSIFVSVTLLAKIPGFVNISDSDQQCITMLMLHLTRTMTSGKFNKEITHLTVGLAPLSVILDVTNCGCKTNHIHSS